MLVLWAAVAMAESKPPVSFKHVPLQYIAALGDPKANAGSGAQWWGLWTMDPGPRGCMLDNYAALKAAGGIAPAQWKFDHQDWWLEEHGLIMEKPVFPIPPGQYVVTGGREVTAVLTIYPSDKTGDQQWELGGGATLYDVTHLPCRAARYRPAEGGTCSPDVAQRTDFPVTPGAAMPAVKGCHKQDYAVLFLIGTAQ